MAALGPSQTSESRTKAPLRASKASREALDANHDDLSQAYFVDRVHQGKGPLDGSSSRPVSN
jgi:hypothetical protein